MNAMKRSRFGRALLRSSTALSMLLLLVLVACDSPASPDPRVPVAHLEVGPRQVDLAPGDTLRLHATAFDAGHSHIPDAEVSWWSIDPRVASVSSAGLVEARAAGEVTVWAASDDVEAFANVRVHGPESPPPAITMLEPSALPAGSSPFSLAVHGTGFTVGSRVLWNGEERITTFVGPTLLRAWVERTDLESAGTAEVRVESPSPGGGLSAPRTFTVVPPANDLPVLTSISPEQTLAGGHGFTLTVTGQGFRDDAVVLWNGAQRPTSRVSDRELRAEIGPNEIWMPGSSAVSVTHRSGGGTTAARTFTAAPSGVTRVVVAPDTLRLDPFQDGQLEGRALDASGAPVGGRYMAWSAENGTIAEVFGDGAVRALRPGTTRIRIANGEHAAYATVIVGPHRVHYIEVDPSAKAVMVGEQVQLRARTFAQGGEEIFGRAVTWRAGEPSVATVDANGKVTALSKGRTYVYAESEGRRTWAVLDVREWPAEPIWVFQSQFGPGELIPVGDTTWVDEAGRTQRAEMLLISGLLTLDRMRGTYTQQLRIWVAASSNPFQIVSEDRGTFQPAVWPQGTLLFTSTTTAGYTFGGRLRDPGELLLEQRIRTAALRSYLYMVR